MPNVRELRDITQREKVEGRERPWLYRSAQRGPSIYITKALINSPITPNQVSLLVIIVGLSGCALLLLPEFEFKIIGLLLLYLNILLDKVDGELARYKKTFSLRGVYLDEINHLTIPAVFFVALTLSFLGDYVLSASVFLAFGMMAAISMPFIRIGHSLAPQIFVKKYLKKKALFTLPEAGGQTSVEKIKKQKRGLYLVANLIHQFQEFFMILLTFIVAIIAQEYLLTVPITQWLIVLYGILLPLVFVENTLKGFLQIEQRISDLDKRFKINQ